MIFPRPLLGGSSNFPYLIDNDAVTLEHSPSAVFHGGDFFFMKKNFGAFWSEGNQYANVAVTL